tara:strand:- start:899 stop:2416 length:1518 start_codon:yes stop_codon:yes gene_type:complete
MLFDSYSTKKYFGILVHPSSLPEGTYCGTFGDGLKNWIKLLSRNKVNAWQFLPLSPTDAMGSPYSSPSSFAINPWFLDFDELLRNKFILIDDSSIIKNFNSETINFFEFHKADELSEIMGEYLLDAWKYQSEYQKNEFNSWCNINNWVEDYALFMTIKDEFEMLPWWNWPKEFRYKDSNAMKEIAKKKAKFILKQKLIQWHLNRQWIEIKKFAEIKGINLIGDLPFYVAKDSVDVWSNKSLFKITSDGDLIFQSGVPPDYFSSTGQLWGTPVYCWSKHEETKFDWWKKRFKRQFDLAHLIRLDHFRAMARYWQVEGNACNAINGEWIKSPGNDLLNSLRSFLDINKLPIIAEDLGIITEEVDNLREKFELPGMKILQFAFDGNNKNPYLPKNIIEKNCIVYTGTHDNSTSKSWWDDLEQNIKQQIKKEYNFKNNPSWDLIELGMKTNAKLFIAPIQDILCLDDRSRLNKPGTVGNNWRWKINSGFKSIEPYIERYGALGKQYSRI